MKQEVLANAEVEPTNAIPELANDSAIQKALLLENIDSLEALEALDLSDEQLNEYWDKVTLNSK